MATLQQLQAFLAVVDHGGFTAAGRQLGSSQPAVSRAIASLERELGLPLLMRRADGVGLTEAGTRAIMHARESVRHWQLMAAEISAMAGEVAGILRVASLPFTTDALITPQLRTFAERHPGVEIRILEGGELEIRDWLDQGAVDAGVVSLPAKGLTTAFLAAQDMLAVVPADHRLARLDEICYADLAKEAFVRATGGCARFFMAVARQVGVEFDAAYEARDMAAVVEIVRAGLGVSILPAAAVLHRPPEITVRLLVPRTRRNLAVAINATAGPAAKAFLDQIAVLRPE